jgi:hypothetical protein
MFNKYQRHNEDFDAIRDKYYNRGGNGHPVSQYPEHRDSNTHVGTAHDAAQRRHRAAHERDANIETNDRKGLPHHNGHGRIPYNGHNGHIPHTGQYNRNHGSDEYGKDARLRRGTVPLHRRHAHTDYEDEEDLDDDCGLERHFHPTQNQARRYSSTDASDHDDYSDDDRVSRPTLCVRRRITPMSRAQDGFEIVVRDVKKVQNRQAHSPGNNKNNKINHNNNDDNNNNNNAHTRGIDKVKSDDAHTDLRLRNEHHTQNNDASISPHQVRSVSAHSTRVDSRQRDERDEAWHGGPRLYVTEKHSLLAQARAHASMLQKGGPQRRPYDSGEDGDVHVDRQTDGWMDKHVGVASEAISPSSVYNNGDYNGDDVRKQSAHSTAKSPQAVDR